MKPKLVIIFLFLLSSNSMLAQADFSAKTWHFIDTSIAKRRNLVNLTVIINELQQKAMAAENYFYYGRCLDYKIQLADQRTEDSFYFKNSAIIDTLLLQKQLPSTAQYVLHLMAAKRLKLFVAKYKRYNQNRYERRDLVFNYAAFTNTELDSIASLHFEKAKMLAQQINAITVDDALWLSPDPLQFLFKPGLFDIAIAAQINSLAVTNRYRASEARFKIGWLLISQDAFIEKLDSAVNTPTFGALILYREWLGNKKQDLSAYYFIETLARKYFYNAIRDNDTNAEKDYELYLRELLQSPYNTVRAHTVYQLCLLLNSQGKKYFPANEYGYRGYNASAPAYDTAYRFHPAKALSLFRENEQMLDSFFYLKNILLQMEGQIRNVDLQFSMQTDNLPGEPLLGELKFKNAGQLFYRIVAVDRTREATLTQTQTGIVKLLAKPVVASGAVILPAASDYNYHNTYVKFDSLATGNYQLIFADKNLSDSDVIIRTVHFSVTNITVINNDSRVYVLNRKTGMPLYGASVEAGYFKEIKKDSVKIKKYVSEKYVVNKSGYVVVRNADYKDLTVKYGNDSITERISFPEKDEPEEVYSKEDYEDLVEFYDEEATAYVFTDRSIYRPGQTVYYKAIFVTKNPKTGEPMLMSKKNLKGKLFGSVYKKWLKEEEPWLFVTDPFNKELDSLKIVPNEFGSVSGSFKIPKTAATGEWEITPDYIDMDSKYGTFKVEEYKRPSYEITIDKPKKELRIKEAFSFKVHIKSFAGAALNNVRINYTTDRNGWLPVFDSMQQKTVSKNIEEGIIKSTGYTDATGTLEIFIKDSLLNKYNLADSEKWSLSYNMELEAVDATGESYNEKARVNISSKPVKLKLTIQNKMNRAELPKLLFTAEDENAGAVNKMVRVRFYKTTTKENLYTDRKLTRADEWLYGKEMLQQWFPQVDFYLNETKVEKKLVWETTVNTGLQEKLLLSPAIFAAGNYTAEAICEEGGKVIGEISRSFAVYDALENKLPEQNWSFNNLAYNSVQAGDSIKYYFGSSGGTTFSVFHLAYYSGKKKRTLEYFYHEEIKPEGLQLYKLKIPEAAVGQMKLTQIFILNNQLFKHEERIYVDSKEAAREPEIIIEKYRKNLTPGSREIFTISVKTKNENVAAELMTTMYDASLDKLEKHTWEIPRNKNYSSIDTDWPSEINYLTNSANNFVYHQTAFSAFPPSSSQLPLWWVNPLDYAYTDVIGERSFNERARRNEGFDFDPFNGNVYNSLAGKVAGVNISSTKGLSEVVVTSAFGVVRTARSTSSNAIMIRGQSSISNYSQPLVILDGVVFEGDLSKLDPLSITQGLVLKGAEAAALYGARGAQGVLVLSTKGNIVFPKEPEPVIIPRKNFNESAFFFPATHADKDGFYSFSFTMPETVTEWNWKMLAHTKLAKFVYAERKLNTQLPLMVQPNMPRLLYQGDRIILQSRISNLDSLPATGKIFCKIEDVVTGDDITDKLISVRQHDFSLSKKENKAVAFEIKIPAQQLNPVKIIVKVSSASFTDGEEHIIPVLSPRVFVRQSQPFYFQNNTDTVLKTAIIPAGAQMYGMAVSVNPKPQSALLNALPWLAGYPYGCAEQTFNKLLANATALKLMRTDETAQRSFDAAKKFVDFDKNGSSTLPDELNEETMPWLNNANQSSLLKKQLFNLLDTSKTLVAIKELLQKIYKLQNADGGISWFNGGESNFYISNYLLRGFGAMNKDSLYFPDNSSIDQHSKLIAALIVYNDKEFARLLNIDKQRRPNLLNYVYARSFWQKQNPVADSMLKNIQAYLYDEWKTADRKSLYDQSLLIITSLRFAHGDQELVAKLLAQLNSIRQLAISDEQHGIRWKDLADADDLNISSEETIALIADAFKESGGDETIRNGIVKWLLTVKNEHHWTSTKATASVITLLFKNNRSVVGETQTINATLTGKNMRVTDDLLSGVDYDFSDVHTLPASVKLTKAAPVAAAGSLVYFYFTDDSLLNSLNKDIQLEKKMYVWNAELNTWELINSNTVLKIADKVRVILTIQSSRSLPFVFIDDKRAAAFEPAENSSGYEYGSGMGYYKSVRDAGYHFFAENIPSGRHEIVYELKVSQEGSFASGPAVLQCMYKPDIAAYSNGTKIVTER